MSLRIGILASGTGSNALRIIEMSQQGRLDVNVRVVLCNRPGAPVIEKARAAGVNCEVLDHTAYGSREEHDKALADSLQNHGCELIVLAGYMRLFSTPFVQLFAGRMVNIHPAILPSFPGTHGARDALEYGVKLSGPSVHFVTEKMDSGPLIIQAAVPVHDNDNEETLQNRIHALEHRIYPQALQWIAEGRLSIQGRHVRLAPSAKKSLIPNGDWFVWPPLEEGF